jgi:ribosome assembly protein YihI (activator of Der GTPase)
MANMSYCRFRNTENDLDDCLYALENGDELSNGEFNACERMFDRFIGFCIEQGIIEDDGELDDRLKDFLDSLNKE